MKTIEHIKVEVPKVQDNFVPFGYYEDLKQILATKQFFPLYLYGLSGVGKTKFVIQACAELDYPLVRVNLTDNTTEDHLIGGFRLINGETVFYKGPVIQAMEAGAVLLLDEGDQAPPTVNMCLQAILEGDGYLIKQTGEKVKPKPGFTIILAANTKGKGDETGIFIGAQIQNEANLDRYLITFEHEYPPEKIERKIILNEFKLNGLDPKDGFHEQLVAVLVKWANNIRKGTTNGVNMETMSTRRLVHFAKTFSIFKHKTKTLKLVLSRFDVETKNSWNDLFSKVDHLKDVDTSEQYVPFLEKVEREKKEALERKGKEAEWTNTFYDVAGTKTTSTTGDVSPW